MVIKNIIKAQLRQLQKDVRRNIQKQGIDGLNGEEEYLALKSLSKQARCTKCGERILADEDSMCGRCI